jgi:L,D-transpeptidase ErfK/SrfK
MAWSSRLLKAEKNMMHGPDILELQLRLEELGYYQGQADGRYTLATQRAVKSFQQALGLKDDGVVGPITWLALNRNAFEHFKAEPALTSPEIMIDIDRRVLIYAAPQFMKTYPVAVGRPSLPTPLGNWSIVSKALNPRGAFGVRWMRLSIPWGGYGIHGTNNPKSIGKAVSHGCVRMYNTDVIEVYERTPVGTPVTIIGKAYNRRTLKIGDQGSDVQEIQKMLKKLRFYRAKLDGEYGPYTEQAVRNFQQEQSLMVDGMVGSATLTAIQRAYAQTF